MYFILPHSTTMEPCVVWEFPSPPIGDPDCRDVINEKPCIVGAQPTGNYANSSSSSSRYRQRADAHNASVPMLQCLRAQHRQPALEGVNRAGLRHIGGEPVPGGNGVVYCGIFQPVRVIPLLLELVSVWGTGSSIGWCHTEVFCSDGYLPVDDLIEECQALQ